MVFGAHKRKCDSYMSDTCLGNVVSDRCISIGVEFKIGLRGNCKVSRVIICTYDLSMWCFLRMEAISKYILLTCEARAAPLILHGN